MSGPFNIPRLCPACNRRKVTNSFRKTCDECWETVEFPFHESSESLEDIVRQARAAVEEACGMSQSHADATSARTGDAFFHEQMVREAKAKMAQDAQERLAKRVAKERADAAAAQAAAQFEKLRRAAEAFKNVDKEAERIRKQREVDEGLRKFEEEMFGRFRNAGFNQRDPFDDFLHGHFSGARQNGRAWREEQARQQQAGPRSPSAPAASTWTCRCCAA